MKKALIITVTTLLCSTIYAQKSSKKADEYFNDFKFKEAIELYHQLTVKYEKPNQHVIQKLADSYFNISDYQNAKIWYEKLYALKGKNIGENTFIKFIQSLKAYRDYDMANTIIKEYYKDDYGKLKMIATQKKHLDSLSLEDPLYEIFDLDINSSKSDFAPMYYDHKIVFASSRDTAKHSYNLYSWNNQPYLDVYVAERDVRNGELNHLEKFLTNLESTYHDATLTFSSDLKTVYFTRNFLNKSRLKTNDEGVSNMQILKGNIVMDKIIDIKPLKFNSPDYSCGHPFLTPDGKYLFFVSDMPGGYGETDIYVVEVFEDGTTNTPINLGPTINTSGREMFPFLVNNTLYFSSDTHFGLGGLDMFESEMGDKNQYSLPLNLGAPINSNMDDFAYIFDPEESTGYFSSNRFMGKGDDDIYFFRKKKAKISQTYSGLVLDEKTKEPVPQAVVKVYDIFNELTTEITSDKKGFYTLKLPCGTEHKLVFSKPEYNKKSVLVKNTDKPCLPLENNNVYLIPYESLIEKEGDVEKIKVEPIYFDFNKFDITSQAIIELEKVVFAMNEFPNIKIKIESHTDSRGGDNYNLKLSDKRAKATLSYLISRNISPDRIESAMGYGETRLKNQCGNGIKCSDQEHLINRRSDFIVIEK